tara:strand:- start:795 stop:953 length:159 start_codon:yes stop_codon:yes gene_type:complete
MTKNMLIENLTEDQYDTILIMLNELEDRNIIDDRIRVMDYNIVYDGSKREEA